jgi:hypothetical protein
LWGRFWWGYMDRAAFDRLAVTPYNS